MAIESLQVPLLVGFGVILVAAFALQQYLVLKRRKDLAKEAALLGWAYLPPGQGDWLFDQKHSLFNRGRFSEILNLLSGTSGGGRAWLVDLSYETGSGKNRSTHSQTVAIFETPASLPSFELFPERFYHRIAEAVGYKDIDFEGFERFSDEYRLLGEDEAAVRRLFSPPVVGRLQDQPGWTIEAAERLVLVYHPEVVVKVEAVADFLQQTRELARLFSAR